MITYVTYDASGREIGSYPFGPGDVTLTAGQSWTHNGFPYAPDVNEASCQIVGWSPPGNN